MSDEWRKSLAKTYRDMEKARNERKNVKHRCRACKEMFYEHEMEYRLYIVQQGGYMTKHWYCKKDYPRFIDGVAKRKAGIRSGYL